MYAFIRRYRMGAGSLDDLMSKVDRQFASRLVSGGDTPAGVPAGVVSYQAIATGDRTIVTVTMFETEADCRRAEQAARDIRLSLAEFEVEETDTFTGEVMLSRASEALLTPIVR